MNFKVLCFGIFVRCSFTEGYPSNNLLIFVDIFSRLLNWL